MKENDINNQIIITDILIRLKSLENLLISKGVFSLEEFKEEAEKISISLAKNILTSASLPSDQVEAHLAKFKTIKN